MVIKSNVINRKKPIWKVDRKDNMIRTLRTHKLVKLRIETVQNLKRLLSQTGQASLDNLIMKMVRLTDAQRVFLKDTGWSVYYKGGKN